MSLTDGCWSPTPPSVFFITRQDGYLDTWDVLYQHKAHIVSTKVSDEAINCIKVHHDSNLHPLNQVKSHCFLFAVGCNDGNTTLMEFSDSLNTCNRCAPGLNRDYYNNHRTDKAATSEMYKRETRKEKILEALIWRKKQHPNDSLKNENNSIPWVIKKKLLLRMMLMLKLIQ